MSDTAPEFAPVETDPDSPLGEVRAEAFVASTAFKTGPPRLAGVELEWLVYDIDLPAAHVPVQRVRAALDGLPTSLAACLTTEPGGQLELSSPPAPLAECLTATSSDLELLRQRLAAARLRLAGYGLDPVRAPVRQRTDPRYIAMERHFDRRGSAGRLMMCSTASVQVCVDAGRDDAEIRDRWSALYALAPTLVALFANSPVLEGRPTGWRCSRQAVWSKIDPCRTRPPADVDPGRDPRAPAEDPRVAYARYALDAELLAVRRPGQPWGAPAGLTFRAWLRGDGPATLGRPTQADLDYHLSTLFPPVRPRGHLELRVLDAQPGDGWRLATAVVSCLLDDPVARDEALAAVERVRDCWWTAPRLGLADRDLAAAGAGVLAAATAAMRRAGLPADLVTEAGEYAERYPAHRRTPADDLLDHVPARPQPRRAASRREFALAAVRHASDPGAAATNGQRFTGNRPTVDPVQERSVQ
jgi:glutamate--cysteine ligase